MPSHPRSASERCANVLPLLEKGRGVIRIAISVGYEAEANERDGAI